ncbi:protein kinase domain protein, partial [Gregarina niphandrodes]
GNTLDGSWDHELRTVLQLRHPNLVLVLGYVNEVVEERGGAVRLVEPMALISEYCNGGTLFRALHRDTYRLTWRQRLKILYDVAVACRYLHSAGLIHRDLKSLNILLDRKVKNVTDIPKAKITDFGMCVPNPTGRAGTYQWMAPEVYLMLPSQGAKQDVYSFGVLIYECVANCIPYSNLQTANHNIAHLAATKGIRPDPRSLPNDMPSQLQYVQHNCTRETKSKTHSLRFRNLMVQCWLHEPEKRPNFSEISDTLGSLYKQSCGNSSQQ